MIEEGLFRNNYEAFWQQNDKLLFKHIGDLKRYAIRVLANTHHTFVQLDHKLSALPVDNEGNIVDEGTDAFANWHDEESQVTVGQVLARCFPELFSPCLNDDGEET